MSESLTDETVLYEAIGVDGEVLYIGITGNIAKRLAEHRRRGLWFHLAESVRVTTFPVGTDVKWEETCRIREIDPPFNIGETPRHRAATMAGMERAKANAARNANRVSV